MTEKATKKAKRQKKQKGQKARKSKEIIQRLAGTGGIDLEKLDRKDPDMASAVRKMLELEEIHEGELEYEGETDTK